MKSIYFITLLIVSFSLNAQNNYTISVPEGRYQIDTTNELIICKIDINQLPDLSSYDSVILSLNTTYEFATNPNNISHEASYLVENNIVAYQNGSVAGGNNASHHLVFRGSLSSSTWGEEIINGTASQDMILSKTYSIEIPAGYNKENFTYGIIVWKKLGGNYQYVNAATNQ